MNPTIILAAILAGPVLVLSVLRINAALVFLSLCLGNVLVQFIGPDAGAIVASTSAHTHGIPTSQSYVDLALLLLPVVLTMVMMIGSVRGGARHVLNFFPAAGVGLLGALLAVPLLSVNLTGAIMSLALWHKLENLQALILGISTLLCLMVLWMARPKRHKEEAKHR